MVIFEKTQRDFQKWKKELSNLVEFANSLVQDIIRIHKRSYEVMLPYKMHITIFGFAEICKVMLEEFKARLDVARK